jgi:hypothetical protein
MAFCKYCGATPLIWSERWSGGFDLLELDGEHHNCKPEDRKREYERKLKEKAETDEATRRYREANGYI